MQYDGRYKAFDPTRIRTYPLAGRSNKVTMADLTLPSHADTLTSNLPESVRRDVRAVAEAVVTAWRDEKPVILFTGAHLIKNGLGPLLADLVQRRLVTLVAGNGATSIHDFELALIGQTSENVPAALGTGAFGMAYEFAYINAAVSEGDRLKLGYGEALGRMICERAFAEQVFSSLGRESARPEFQHPEVSVLAACYENEIPFTVHVGIGTDVIDQHPSFDGQAKGGCSGRDFLIYTQEVTRLCDGGVTLNIGSAVTGPEVLLKAVSMAANIGKAPRDILAVDLDLRPHDADQMTDETAAGYYFRDQKSVVTRIPEAVGGRGLYIQADQRKAFPLLYAEILKAFQGRE